LPRVDPRANRYFFPFRPFHYDIIFYGVQFQEHGEHFFGFFQYNGGAAVVPVGQGGALTKYAAVIGGLFR